MSINIGSQAMKAFYFSQKKLSRLILNAKTVWQSGFQYEKVLWTGSAITGSTINAVSILSNLTSTNYLAVEITISNGNKAYFAYPINSVLINNTSTPKFKLLKDYTVGSDLPDDTVYVYYKLDTTQNTYSISVNSRPFISDSNSKMTGIFEISSQQYISGGGRTPSYQRFWTFFRKNTLPSWEAVV